MVTSTPATFFSLSNNQLKYNNLPFLFLLLTIAQMGGVESNMAVATLSTVSDIEEEHGLILRSHFIKNIAKHLCDLEHPYEIRRETLDEAILLLPPSDVSTSDNKMIECLFVMHDRRYTNTVDYKDLLLSLSLLVSGSVKEKMLYAFRIFDERNTGGVTTGELRKILNCINITAMYFGDPGLTDLNIKEILHDIFLHSQVKSAPLAYEGFIDDLVEHEVVKKFLGGWGQAKFGDSSKNS